MKKLLLFLLLLPAWGYAQPPDQEENGKRPRRWLPSYLNAQFAGSIGFVSAGPGYSFARDRLSLGLLYGYVPASQGGDYINTLNLKLSGDIMSFRLGNRLKLVPYAALLVSVETSGNSIIKLPERYPDGYYLPTGIHLLGALGGSLRMPLGQQKKGHVSFYAETGTVDSYVYYYLRNSVQSFTELFSASLGVTYHFR